jgi:hypothetical protein
MPLVGDAQNDASQRKDTIASMVPLTVPPSPTINANTPKTLAELVATWEQLSDMHRQALLSVAGQLQTHCEEQRDALARQEVAPPQQHWRGKWLK